MAAFRRVVGPTVGIARAMNRTVAICCSNIVPVFVLSLGTAALGDIPAGYLANTIPVLADARYHDSFASVTADGLTMVFMNTGPGFAGSL